MGRPRPRRGERRIDAAIDHLAQYGFPRPQIRKIINNLLQLYGRDGWVFLEEGSYRVVLDKLLEEQGQLDKQEEAADKATPENDIEVSRAVHSEAPTESQSALEQQASPNSLPPQEHVLPLPPATRAAPARLPCYGWISEESETESELEDGEMLSDVPRPASIPQKDVPNPAETLPSKRKWPTRWDMRPNWG
ncbi:hypothetical protein GQ55_2G185500 [Panicum hallii var. hallii]|uniref:WIYLD domain-containing protein n=1 Tax=Panicum hallii var. hallii TaxID=1504633 RepID=A0A2T7EQB0_9POAL|nr:hypothetical protein GQ55_2G185500 [Panicum hallii var. hallii]